jgi:glutaminyl-tRNA synthetase
MSKHTNDEPGEREKAPAPSAPATNFIREIIDEDLKNGKNDGRVATRFPPEPNGYLHIGHAKSICLNFGIAADYNGACNLRFDDTNPVTEDVEYVESIKEDIRWLGFDWDDRMYFASDYFDQLYEWAIYLIKKGKAYVCDLSEEEIRQGRGDFYRDGEESPFRHRSVAENLDLFARMRAGEFPDGSKTLRAKIDMKSPNMNLRDPLMYRIKRATHHRTGDKWLIYPMYDYAHGESDAIEGITHSICTLEFEDHRPLYEWFVRELDLPRPPRQIEFARLNLTHTVMSKRLLLQLVQEKLVSGWDDPRMPTITGLRRRGYTPEALRAFCDQIGVAKADSTVEVELLEHAVRDDLNERAPRVMAVLHPLKVVIENYPADQTDAFEIPLHPEKPEMGLRKAPFGREVYIERDDFREVPPKKWFRLAPGMEVRLRGACIIKCTDVVKDQNGEVIELRCTWDPASRGGAPADGRKIKGTLHWVSAAHALDAEVRLYDRLFNKANPYETEEGQNFKANLNPNSLEVLTGCKVEPSLAGAPPERHFQFERLGYFCTDRKDSSPTKLVFNQTVSLRDSWAKIEKVEEPKAAPKQEAKPAAPPPAGFEPPGEPITIGDFAQADLRVAEVVAAATLPGSKKLIQLTLDLGPLGRRSVLAGIAEHVADPQTLVGKRLICVANLAPRKMKWGVSEGMILAAASQTAAGEHLALVEAPNGKPGERVQ